jgi:HEAT repeat protein
MARLGVGSWKLEIPADLSGGPRLSAARDDASIHAASMAGLAGWGRTNCQLPTLKAQFRRGSWLVWELAVGSWEFLPIQTGSPPRDVGSEVTAAPWGRSSVFRVVESPRSYAMWKWVTTTALAGFSALTLATVASGQTSGAAAGPAAPGPQPVGQRVREGERTESLRQGRLELAAGKPDAARFRAERLLLANPADTDAYLLGVDAYNARADRMGALALYRRVMGPREDFVLLSPIARAELDLLLKSPLPGLRAAAEALLARLSAEAGAASAAPPRDLRRFSEMTRDNAPDKRAAGLDALVDNDSPEAKAAVVSALADPDFQVRMSAMNGVVALHAQEAAPQLKSALGDPNPLVRVQAASALRRLGDKSGDAALKDALASPFRGGRLVAARALNETGDASSWVSAIAPLLDSEQPIERVMAAELLAATAHRDRARTILQDATGDPNELVRDQASRVLASEPDRPQPTPYAALGDESPWVRLKAAETVLMSPPVVTARKAAAAKAAAEKASAAKSPAAKPATGPPSPPRKP